MSDVELSIGIDTAEAVRAVGNIEKATKDVSASLAVVEKNAKATGEKVAGVVDSMSNLAKAAVAFFAAKSVINFFEEGIKGAVAQEQAFARLSAQMEATGEYSETAAKAFNDLAGELESTTKFGDDAVLSAAALAKSYGLTNDQAMELVRTSADLASATGDTLEGAVEQLTASYSGNVKAIGKLVPEIKGLTKEQLAAGEGVKLLQERFKGAANSEIKTYAGAVKQATNAFENYRESFGTIITQNKSVTAVINGVGKLFQNLQKVVEDNQETLTAFVNVAMKGLVIGISIVVDAIHGLILGFGLISSTAVEVSVTVLKFFGDINDAIEFITGKNLAGDFFDEAAKSAEEFSTTTLTAVSKVDDVMVGISDAVEKFSVGVFEATETSDKGMKKAEKSTKAYSRGVVEAAEDTGKLREEAKKFLQDLTKTGASESEKIIIDSQAAFDRLGELVQKGVVSQEEAKNASLKITQIQVTKQIELRQKEFKAIEDAAKKATEEARAAIERAAADPIKFTIEKLDIQKLDFSAEESKIAGAGVGVLGKMLEGAAGAKSLISAGAAAFGDALIPGIGGAVGSVISKLSEGPEATKKFIKEFIAAVPDIVTAIAESTSVAVEVFVDTMVNKGGAERIGLAVIRAMSGEAILKNIGRQIGVSFGDNFNADVLGRKIGNGFMSIGEKLTATFTNLGKLLYDSLFNGAIVAGQNLATAIADIPVKLGEAFGGLLAQLGTYVTEMLPAQLLGAFDAIFKFFSEGLGGLVSTAFDPIINLFTVDLPNLAYSAFKPIIDFFNSFKIEMPKIPGTGGGGVGGFFSNAGKAASSLIPKFSQGGVVYAAGGFIPRGTDTVPAMLTPGEMVLNRGQQANLFNLANNGGGGDVAGLLRELIGLMSQPQTTSVRTEVNGKAFADIILQQSRQRARLTA